MTPLRQEPTLVDRLSLLLRSEHPIVSLQSRDEIAALALVRSTADAMGLPLCEWTLTGGISQTRPEPRTPPVEGKRAIDALEFIANNKSSRVLYLFRDIAPHAKDPLVQRRLCDLYTASKAHLLLLDSEPLPDPVRRLPVPFRMPTPDVAELERILKETFRDIEASVYSEVRSTLSNRDKDQIVQTLRGLTATEARRVLAAAIHDDYTLEAADMPRIIEAKRNLLESSGCLEAITVNVRPDEVGGLANLKSWLAKRRGGLTAKGRSFGLVPPRGVLLLGVQGCGKSLCAKVVAADWGMPLLRMDPGVFYQKYVGESESRLRDTLDQAEAMAPAILWIDEIEKAFASAAADSADGGLSQRMFGSLLSWMQDHTSPIFMVATANNIAALPPELMRKGRFDEIFFVNLPDAAARRLILSIHIKRRKRDPGSYDLDALARATDGFSGAEIEQAVNSALYAAFAAGSELTSEHLLAEARQTKPLSILMAEKIRVLREWAIERCVPAD